MYPRSMFWAKNEHFHFFHLKIIVFTAVKNCCILHGRVIIMDYFFPVGFLFIF